MADSGVDTSNDSCCTNDNSNSESANTSFSKDLMDAFSDAFGSNESGTSTSEYFKSPEFLSQRNKKPNPTKHTNKLGRYQHHHTTRNALVPYVCKLPNERKLRLAASVSNIELLVRLLDSGVNPNTADEHLRCPLHLAASRGYKDVVKILLTRGANPNRQDSLGNTPLHLAVCSASSYNFNMVVRILLQNGARVNILDRSGKTPLDLARSKLLLMRTRLGIGTTPETAKLFVEMSMLTGLLHRTLLQQRKELEFNDLGERLRNLSTKDAEFDDLEQRLRNLSTKEIEDGADNLLKDVAGLTIN